MLPKTAITQTKGYTTYIILIQAEIINSSVSKESACNLGDLGSIPGSGRFSGEENGNPLQYSCLENPMDRETWWATDHGTAKSQIQLGS